MKILIDMDGVSCDFYKSPLLDGTKRGYGNYPEMYEPGFFENLPPIPGALSAIRAILNMFPGEVYILTQPVSSTYYSYSEKAAWIKKWIPELRDFIIMAQHKELLAGPGRFLIDDNKTKWESRWVEAGGRFIHFDEDKDPRENWKAIIELLRIIKGREKEISC